jgi:hypothetical protein
MKSRLVGTFPGIDPSSWKSPGFKKPRVPAKRRFDGPKSSPKTQNPRSKHGKYVDSDLGLNADSYTDLIGRDEDEDSPPRSGDNFDNLDHNEEEEEDEEDNH